MKYFSLIQNYISYTQWVSMLHSWLRVFCIKMVNKGEENNNLEEVTRLLEWDCSSNKFLLNRGTVFAQSLMWWWFVFFCWYSNTFSYIVKSNLMPSTSRVTVGLENWKYQVTIQNVSLDTTVEYNDRKIFSRNHFLIIPWIILMQLNFSCV